MPWPATVRGSSYGWITVSPRREAISSMRSRASSKVSPSSRTSAPSTSVFSTFTKGAKRGITIVAGMPRRFAWQATPCAWLPAETAITPRARSPASSARSLFSAPRSLKDAVNCRFSNLRNSSQPAIADSVRECRKGVSATWSRMRLRAASTSPATIASGGIVSAR